MAELSVAVVVAGGPVLIGCFAILTTLPARGGGRCLSMGMAVVLTVACVVKLLLVSPLTKPA